MLVHAGRCKWKGTHYMDRILDCRGPMCKREYKVRWAGCDQEDDTWEPRSHIHPNEIKEFEQQNDLYDNTWPHRCDVCFLPFRTSRGVKIHRSKVHKEANPQNFKGTLADRAVQEKKWEAQQRGRPVVKCEGQDLENTYKCKYLGSLFSADAQQCFDIRTRIAIVMKRCGQLKHIFDSPNIGPLLKLRLYLYTVSICTLMSYGCESWTLTEEVIKKLNNANSLMLSRVTGNPVRQEARAATSSHNFVRHIRLMRYKWLGEILRGDQTRLVFQAARTQYDMGTNGNLFMDAPPHNNFDDLVIRSIDKVTWNEHARYII